MFKLHKSKGIVNNTFVSDIPVGTELDTLAEKANGLAVAITAGVLEIADTGDAVAGIFAVEGGTSYGTDEQGNDLGSPTFVGTADKNLFMPVGREVLIEADTAAADAVTIGAAYDIAAGGLTIDLDAQVNGDFKVLKIIEGTASAATKVAGVFTDPTGYFA